MDINFKFTNLIGAAYRNGELTFSPDGNSIFSPVGNKINVFDLKNNISRTINVDSDFTITSVALNETGSHLIVSNEAGHVIYVNLLTETPLFTFRSGSTVKVARFSPNGKLIAIGKGNDLQLHNIATSEHNMYYPFLLNNTYRGSSGVITCIDWSDDGNLIAYGSEDKIVRVAGSKKFKQVVNLPLASHKGTIINAQFLHKSYDLVTVDSRGFCQVWTSSIMVGDLVEGDYIPKPENGAVKAEDVTHLYYEKSQKFSVIEAAGTSNKHSIEVSACRLHAPSSVMVTCYTNGVFVLHEIPTFALIHNLRVSELRVNSVSFNATGDWIGLGLGVGSQAQLVVWEWQSETYVMKQQAHSQRVVTGAWSPDGALLATGAEDGKVKIWNSRSGFCVVTFEEHTSGVSGVCWTQNGKAILSASLDGTIRAHDLKRYRNFRTLVCPEPTQLGRMVVDKAGDLVVACGKEIYNIFIWSLETGRLLDVLSGHESNISAIDIAGNRLASTSWDRMLKIWNIVDSSSETTDLGHEALDVKFTPCGQIVAALTVDSQVTFYLADDMSFVGIIEGKLDLDSGRSSMDILKKDNSQKSKSFTCMEFSPDGQMLLLGGDSNIFCMYSVADRVIIRRFTITKNRSLEGVVIDVNRRNFSEFGNMALIDTSDEEADLDHKRAIKLPGSKHTDIGERKGKMEVAVHAIAYCPTGRRFSVCSTEGVSVYSLDADRMFDPFQLDSQTSPEQVKLLLSNNDFTTALMAALRLGESEIIRNVIEATPVDNVELVVGALSIAYVEKFLKWASDGDAVWSSQLVHFYMLWLRACIHKHGLKLKGRTDVAVLTGIQQIVNHYQNLIVKMTDENKYGLRYLLQARKLKKKEIAVNDEPMEE